ncbi:MAG TPA: tagaturonate epimerase family protein [Feifaniaceae bacterium]|nr:tagaturonate epimerase family protein [Feifaniaceae bacterium]
MKNSMDPLIKEVSEFLGAIPYEKSPHEDTGGCVWMGIVGSGEFLFVTGAQAGFTGTRKQANGTEVLIAPLTHENADALRKAFPFTAPVRVLQSERTVGVGDRLGIATPGHIRVFSEYDALPVFAQQSIRELTLTRRTFEHVLDCATFAVFKEDFRLGFGADGDHLKTPEEVQYALGCGYTMITLDCSEYIRNDIEPMPDEAVLALGDRYAALQQKYEGMEVTIEGETLRFSGMELLRMLHIYGAAIDFAVKIYEDYMKDANADFEISIDETQTPTTPLQHYFVANELYGRGVRPATIAPRFCGEFQKGIDYIGDIGQFRAEFRAHAAIARRFGYKISVHSGSDKFSVFPTVGELTRGRFHVKTAGTNWLEAMRIVALRDPALYREVHAFALEKFQEARAYYHVTTDLAKIPPLDTLKDAELSELFDRNEARQLIHITYGLILGAKNADGSERFKERLYALWREHAQGYAELLNAHIGRHLKELGVGPRHEGSN